MLKMFTSEFFQPFKLTPEHFILKINFINKEYKNSRLSRIKKWKRKRKLNIKNIIIFLSFPIYMKDKVERVSGTMVGVRLEGRPN